MLFVAVRHPWRDSAYFCHHLWPHKKTNQLLPKIANDVMRMAVDEAWVPSQVSAVATKPKIDPSAPPVRSLPLQRRLVWLLILLKGPFILDGYLISSGLF